MAARLRGMLPQLDERLHVIPVGEDFMLSRLSPGGANFQYRRTNSVGYIKQIHHSVLEARALKTN